MRTDFVALVVHNDRGTDLIQHSDLSTLKTEIETYGAAHGTVFHIFKTDGSGIKKIGIATFTPAAFKWVGKAFSL